MIQFGPTVKSNQISESYFVCLNTRVEQVFEPVRALHAVTWQRKHRVISHQSTLRLLTSYNSLVRSSDYLGACALCVRECVCVLIIPAECEWQRVNIECFNSFNPPERCGKWTRDAHIPPPHLLTYTWMHATHTHTHTHTATHIEAEHEHAATNAGGKARTLCCFRVSRGFFFFFFWDHMVAYLLMRGDPQRWEEEEEVSPGFGRGMMGRGHRWLPGSPFGGLHSWLCRAVISGAGGGMGLSPAGEGRKGRTGRGRGGRVVMKGMTHCSLCSPHRSALPFICLQIDDLQEGGGGEAALQITNTPHPHPYRAIPLWLSWYVTRLPRRPAALTHTSSCVPAVCVPCHGGHVWTLFPFRRSNARCSCISAGIVRVNWRDSCIIRQ